MPVEKGEYCQYCADDQGKLHPRGMVQQGIAQWLEGITPDVKADYMKRAEYYMMAMPAWNR